MSSSTKPPRSGSIVNLSYKEKSGLYTAYMPFVKNGGLFIPSSKSFELGDEVFVVLTLWDVQDELPIPCKVVWITPVGAQNKRKPGIGVQFLDNGTARTRIETILAGTIESDRQTDTM
ncbi:MAG: PilZ domain-containing protein [Gammaproteobacteria bacterium]|nr:PilZ domain-containing protein [Gammaproteobacteria bacterium]